MIAVLAGRSADVLGGFLAKQSPAWRKSVSVVVTDMAECYRTAIRLHLPHARHVADRFHVVCNFAKVLVTARRDAQRTHRARPMTPRCSPPAPGSQAPGPPERRGDGPSRRPLRRPSRPRRGGGLVQRFQVIFCAENEQAANEAVDDFSEAYAAGG